MASREYVPEQQKQMAAGNTDMGILPGLHVPPSKVTSGAVVKNMSVGVLPFFLLISFCI